MLKTSTERRVCFERLRDRRPFTNDVGLSGTELSSTVWREPKELTKRLALQPFGAFIVAPAVALRSAAPYGSPADVVPAASAAAATRAAATFFRLPLDHRQDQH